MSTEVTTATAPVARRAEFSIRGNRGRAISVIVPILIWFRGKDLFRLGLWLTAVESLLLLLLVPLYWPLIGI